jgi:hypothetical protein
MLLFLTILMMLIVAYAAFREGLFTAFNTLVNVVLAGLAAFNFFEPLSAMVEPMLQGGFLDGYQDFFFLMLLFCVSLGLLRMATNNLANYQIYFSPMLQQFGGAAVGLLTGYLVSGFMLCTFETLPWHQNFMNFQPRTISESDLRAYIPPDRVWLSLMRHAGACGFARGSDEEMAESPYDRYPTFDRSGTFELRYLRYRRYTDTSDPIPYQGELDLELGNR